MRRLLFILTLILATAFTLSAASPRWETAEAVPAQVAESIRAQAQSPTVQVAHAVHDGYIYITASSAVQVKVFTILGQLISQDTLPAGTLRLRISARGIYLLKLGSATLRVTI